MPNNKILFIVEGENDEVSFIKKMLSVCSPNTAYEFYSYRCNIHVLAQVLYNEYPDFEDDKIDIQLVLKSKENDKGKRDLLSQRLFLEAISISLLILAISNEKQNIEG